MKNCLCLLLFVLSTSEARLQQAAGAKAVWLASSAETATKDAGDSVTGSRKTLVLGGLAGAYGGTLVALQKTWYQHYARSSFHTFNDAAEWLQVDKAGHAWSAYSLSRATSVLWQWGGLPEQKAVLLGAAGSMAFLSTIELMDAYSEKWGWSWADMAANAGGVLLFAGQQLGWKNQRIQMKFSVAHKRYPIDLQPRAIALFGATWPERILKDYNHQTYWLSTNLHAFLPNSRLPRWLNVAVGYGATGMFGGFENKGYDAGGNLVFSRPDVSRSRQWYLSPDVDLTRIKTRRKGVRTLLFLLNCLKVPAPTLILEGGKWRVAPLLP